MGRRGKGFTLWRVARLASPYYSRPASPARWIDRGALLPCCSAGIRSGPGPRARPRGMGGPRRTPPPPGPRQVGASLGRRQPPSGLRCQCPCAPVPPDSPHTPSRCVAGRVRPYMPRTNFYTGSIVSARRRGGGSGAISASRFSQSWARPGRAVFQLVSSAAASLIGWPRVTHRESPINRYGRHGQRCKLSPLCHAACSTGMWRREGGHCCGV